MSPTLPNRANNVARAVLPRFSDRRALKDGNRADEQIIHMASAIGFQKQNVPASTHEAESIRRARTLREEAIIAKAEADIDAGLGIEDDEVEAWLNALENDPDARLPLPNIAPTPR